MKLTIESCCAAVIQREADLDFSGSTDVLDWLLKKAQALCASYPESTVYLLAYADDGVVWGRLSDDAQTLLTSHNVARAVSPLLRTLTLQQAHLFCVQAEWLLWKDGENRLHARLLVDDADTPEFDACYDESQMLWGTKGKQLKLGFTLLTEGAQGLRHAIPMEIDLNAPPDPRLCVRHYLAAEPFARVVVSRLVSLQ